MASGAEIIHGAIWESTATPLIARIRATSGTYITQASLSSIAYSVFDLTAVPAAIVTSGTISKSSTVFDTLQTSDARWTVDSVGYNFLWIAPASLFPLAPRKYQVEITFTTTDSYKLRVVFQPKTQPLLTTPL